MCIIWPTDDLLALWATHLFARQDGQRQVLVYQMSMQTTAEVAMILPLPVREPATSGACRFLNMEHCPDFFATLEATIPKPFQPSPHNVVLCAPYEPDVTREVVEVGAFDASFVPSRAYFSHLDERFQLPDFFWEGVHAYDDWSFAVFQLRRGRDERHPMAFVFDTSRPGEVFFPTMHLHGASIDAEASFDHVLYAQGLEPVAPYTPRPSSMTSETQAWYPPQNGAGFIHSAQTVISEIDDPSGARELLDDDDAIFQRKVRGFLPNEDIWVSAGDTAPIEPPSEIGVHPTVSNAQPGGLLARLFSWF